MRNLEDQYDQDLHNILAKEGGRRFILGLINRGRSTSPIGVDSNMTYYNQGIRQMSEDIEADVREKHFDLWLLMLREARDANSSCNESDD